MIQLFLNRSSNIDSLLLEQDLAMQAALEWFKANYLVVNNSKTEKIVFSLNHDIYSKNKPVKLLGIYLDSRLSWDSHIDHLCTKLSRVTYLLRKLKTCVSTEMMLTAYYAFFHTHLMYGITLWGNCSNSNKIFIWQKKALRIIKNVSNSESCMPIFKEYQIMPLPCIYIYCCLKNVKEMLHTLSLRKEVHQHYTRNNYLLDFYCARLEKTKRSHIYMQVKLFNKLPEEAWAVGSSNFLKTIGKWLKSKSFYSLDQYLASDTSDLRF